MPALKPLPRLTQHAHSVRIADARIVTTTPGACWSLANRALAMELSLRDGALVMSRLENRLTASPVEYAALPGASVILPGTGPWRCVAEEVVEAVDGGCRVARLNLALAEAGNSGLMLAVHAQIYPGASVCRLWAEVTNTGDRPRLIPGAPFSAGLFPKGEFRLHWLHGGEASANQGLLESEVLSAGYRREVEDSATAKFLPLTLFQRTGGEGDGLLVEMEYLGWWNWRVHRDGAGPAQLNFSIRQPAEIEVVPGQRVALPVITLAVFRGDLDDLGVRLYDWQYRYLWDYTNPEYFARTRAFTWWFYCSRNLQEAFAARLAGLGMPMDRFSELGYEVLWDDAGWSVYPGFPPDNYRSVFTTTDDGPDFSRTQRYLRKKGMKWLLWFAGTPSAGLLATKVGAWGDFEWRTDAVPVAHPPPGLQCLDEDGTFRRTIRQFLDAHPASSFHTCSGGGTYCHQFDIYRYGTYHYLADMGRGPYTNYYFSYLEPPDKGGDLLQAMASVYGDPRDGSYVRTAGAVVTRGSLPPALEDLHYTAETARHTLTMVALPGMFDHAEDNEFVRQDLELYRFLRHEGVAGRWCYVFHPRVDGEAAHFFMQRTDRSRRKSCIIPKCRRKGKITIYPKGLLPDTDYTVSLALTAGRAVRSGADLMANGIALEDYPAREIIFLNLEHRPGSGADTTPPQAPGQVFARRENNVGHRGVGLYWSPGHDDTWLSGHEVARDGHVIARVTVGNYWFDHATGWEEPRQYAVRAVDGDGNRSDWRTAKDLGGEPDAYEALGGHFAEDGRDGWRAEYTSDGRAFRPMPWVAPEKNPAADLGGTPNQPGGADGYREGGAGRVGRGWMQASSSAAIARSWTAPRDGEVRVTGRLVKEWYHRDQGRPLHARILLNRAQVWPQRGTAAVGLGVLKAAQHDLPLKVRKGDVIRFLLEPGREPDNDLLVWMPVIRYAGGAPAVPRGRVARSGRGGADFTYRIPVPPGVYDVRLVFAEPKYAHHGERPIHVEVNGQRVLTDFDIVRAGSGHPAAELAFPYVVPGADGCIRLRFLGGVRYDGKRAKAIVQAVEVLPAFRPTVRVNCGGDRLFVDWNGDVWRADSATTGTTLQSPRPVAQAAPTLFDQPLYQTARTGRRLQYRFSLPPGLYTVHLKFAELWLAPGERRGMRVEINGRAVLEDFDPAEAAGRPEMAADMRFERIAPDAAGRIVVRLLAKGKHHAILQGLEIL